MYDKSQLMRGTLEGCILKILSKNTSYYSGSVVKTKI